MFWESRLSSVLGFLVLGFEFVVLGFGFWSYVFGSRIPHHGSRFHSDSERGGSLCDKHSPVAARRWSHRLRAVARWMKRASGGSRGGRSTRAFTFWCRVAPPVRRRR